MIPRDDHELSLTDGVLEEIASFQMEVWAELIEARFSAENATDEIEQGMLSSAFDFLFS